MTTNAGNLENVLSTSEKGKTIDETKLAKVFSKVKQKENINENIKLKVKKSNRKMTSYQGDYQPNDFADQLIYYRKLRGYTQKQIGQVIGISESTYQRYEAKECEMEDVKRINKLAEFLEFEEQPIMSDYTKFMSSNPEKKLQQYLKKNKISKNKFSELSGISRRAMLDWFNGKKSISKESYEKIVEFIKNYEKNKEKQKQIEEDEEFE